MLDNRSCGGRFKHPYTCDTQDVLQPVWPADLLLCVWQRLQTCTLCVNPACVKLLLSVLKISHVVGRQLPVHSNTLMERMMPRYDQQSALITGSVRRHNLLPVASLHAAILAVRAASYAWRIAISRHCSQNITTQSPCS